MAPKQKHLSPNDYKRLLVYLDREPPSPMNTVLKLLLRTGARSAELLRTGPEALDSVNSALSIKGAKGSADRIVPLSKRMLYEAQNALYGVESFSESLGIGPCLKSQQRAVQRAWKQVLFRALGTGYQHLTPHGARSSFAVNLYLKTGNDVLLVQELLGHKAISSTMHYVRMSRALERRKALIKAIG